MMCDAGGQFLGIVGYHDEGLIGARAEGIDKGAHHLATLGVEPVKRFVENQQFGVFDEGASQEHHTLLTRGELEEGAVGQVLNTKHTHPLQAGIHLLGTRTHIEPHAIMQARRHNLYGGQVLKVGAMHLGRHVANTFLNVPDTLSCSSTASEEADIASISLWVIATDQAEQGRLATAVTTMQGPTLTTLYLPIESFEDGVLAIAEGYIAEGDD